MIQWNKDAIADMDFGQFKKIYGDKYTEDYFKKIGGGSNLKKKSEKK